MSKLTPTPEQEKAISSIVAEPTHAALIASETGSGKAQPLSEPILTPHGYVPMGDIRVGDFVVDHRGKPTKVLGVFPQGSMEIVELRFTDGTSVRSTWDHLWTVRNHSEKPDSWVTLTTRELIDRGLIFGSKSQNDFRSHRFFMPMVEPVEFESTVDNYPIEPYTLGVLLGDGSLKFAPSLNTDIEIKERMILPVGASFGEEHSRNNAKYNGEWSIRGILPALRSLKLRGKSADKFVPREYLYAPINVRKDVLAGILDTDGSVSGVSIEYGTVSPQLASDVEFLVRSLGGTAKRSVREPWYTYLGERRQGQMFYRLAIRLPENPFTLGRKRDALKDPTKYPIKKAIDSIEVVGYEEAQCIYVDSPEHLYVTKDFAVTHNTVVAVEASVRSGCKTILIIAPLSTFDGWRTRFNEQYPEIPFYEITAKNDSAFNLLKNGKAGAYIIGREFFKIAATTVWHKTESRQGGKTEDRSIPPKRAARWSYKEINKTLDAALIDEIHFAQNRDSNAFSVLKTIHPRRLKIGMSATPGGNKFLGLWAVCRWLWPTTTHEDGTPVVDKSKWRWAATWANIEYDPFSSFGKKISAEKVPGAFVKTLPCYFRDEADKKPYLRYRVQVDVTPEQRKQITSMEEKSLVWLDENPLVADLPIVQKIRLRQMALGEVTFNDEDEVDFADDCNSSKLDACLKIIERHPGEKIFFWTDSKRFARVVAKRLSQQVSGSRAEAWTGDTSQQNRDRIKKDFLDPKSDLRFLAISIAALAEGADGFQRVCSTEVWLNRSFNGVLNEQAEGRLNRTGQKAEHVVQYFLVANDTADSEDFERDARTALTRRMELRS